MERTEDTKKEIEDIKKRRIPKNIIAGWNKGKSSWSKNKKFSEEHKKKISIANKGKHHSEETKLKMSIAKKGKVPWNKGKKGLQIGWNKGKKASDEVKRKLSISHLGLKNNLGNKHTEETKNKIRNSYYHTHHKGCIISEKQRKIIGETHSKEKCHFWKGGIAYLPYPIDWNKALKRLVRERDKYSCRLCGKQQMDTTFPVHHIDYNKNNCNPNNLITLCRNCHGKTNSKCEKWTSYFKNLMEIRLW